MEDDLDNNLPILDMRNLEIKNQMRQEQDYIQMLIDTAIGIVFKCQKGHRYTNRTPLLSNPNWKCIRCGKKLK